MRGCRNVQSFLQLLFVLGYFIKRLSNNCIYWFCLKTIKFRFARELLYPSPPAPPSPSGARSTPLNQPSAEENHTTAALLRGNYCIGRFRRHLVPYKCSQIGRSYLLHLFFRMIREAVGLSKAHLGADAFYCHRREVRQPTPCCMRPSKQVVLFIERHTCNKLGWDR